MISTIHEIFPLKGILPMIFTNKFARLRTTPNSELVINNDTKIEKKIENNNHIITWNITEITVETNIYLKFFKGFKICLVCKFSFCTCISWIQFINLFPASSVNCLQSSQLERYDLHRIIWQNVYIFLICGVAKIKRSEL